MDYIGIILIVLFLIFPAIIEHKKKKAVKERKVRRIPTVKPDENLEEKKEEVIVPAQPVHIEENPSSEELSLSIPAIEFMPPETEEVKVKKENLKINPKEMIIYSEIMKPKFLER